MTTSSRRLTCDDDGIWPLGAPRIFSTFFENGLEDTQRKAVCRNTELFCNCSATVWANPSNLEAREPAWLIILPLITRMHTEIAFNCKNNAYHTYNDFVRAPCIGEERTKIGLNRAKTALKEGLLKRYETSNGTEEEERAARGPSSVFRYDDGLNHLGSGTFSIVQSTIDAPWMRKPSLLTNYSR